MNKYCTIESMDKLDQKSEDFVRVFKIHFLSSKSGFYDYKSI